MAKTCTKCDGRGQTKQTRTVMEKTRRGKLRTKLLGSGCPKCLGTGVEGERK